MKYLLAVVMFWFMVMEAHAQWAPGSRGEKKEVINTTTFLGKGADSLTASLVYDVNGDTVHVILTQPMIDSLQIVALTQAVIDSLQKIDLFPGAKTYADVRNSWDWIRSYTTTTDTVKLTEDTISITATEWSKVTIRTMGTNDSLYYAIGTTAPATFSVLLPGQIFVTEKLNATYFTKVFIRAYSGDESIKYYQVIVEAF